MDKLGLKAVLMMVFYLFYGIYGYEWEPEMWTAKHPEADQEQMDGIGTESVIAIESEFNRMAEELEDELRLGITEGNARMPKIMMGPEAGLYSGPGEVGESCDSVREKCVDFSRCSRRTARDAEIEAAIKYYNFAKYNCRCDYDCVYFGDCCPDAEYNSSIVEQNPKEFEFNELLECGLLPGVETHQLEIYYVQRCPVNYANTQIRQLCENIDPTDAVQNWPVTDWRRLVYTNIYCALCNGVTEVRRLLANIRCSRDIRDQIQGKNTSWIIAFIYQNPSCSVAFQHPNAQDGEIGARVCKPAVNSCPPEWTDECIRNRCENDNIYTSWVYDNTVRFAYRNQHCAVCNRVETACNDRYTMAKYHPLLEIDFDLYPISILVDMNSHSLIGSRVGQGKNVYQTYFQDVIRACADNQVFDPMMDECRNVYCLEYDAYLDATHECVTPNTTATDKCVYLLLNASEYYVLSSGELLDLKSNQSYTNDSFQILANGKALVCTQLTQNYTQTVERREAIIQLKFDKAQTLVSVIGQLLSIIALIIHLVVYSLLPQLRNVAGKNLMCLVSALLVAQILFLVGIGRSAVYGLCVTLAVLIHYFFLASFFWMNVMSYDIWRTFSKTRFSSDDEKGAKKFRAYLCYAWLIPLVIVLVGVCVNFTTPDELDFRPGYGENLCWITHKRALVLLFGVPLICIVGANVVFYSLTVANIYSVSESSKLATQTNKQSNVCRVVLYIKLCAIMGLTWMFAFIAALADIKSIWYLFIIFNSLQGVFICLTFVLTPKVLRSLREKGRKLWSDVNGSTDEQTRTTRFTRTSSSEAPYKISNVDVMNTPPSKAGADTSMSITKSPGIGVRDVTVNI